MTLARERQGFRRLPPKLSRTPKHKRYIKHESLHMPHRYRRTRTSATQVSRIHTTSYTIRATWLDDEAEIGVHDLHRVEVR